MGDALPDWFDVGKVAIHKPTGRRLRVTSYTKDGWQQATIKAVPEGGSEESEAEYKPHELRSLKPKHYWNGSLWVHYLWKWYANFYEGGYDVSVYGGPHQEHLRGSECIMMVPGTYAEMHRDYDMD